MGLIDVVRTQQVISTTANVGHVKHCILRHFPLNIESPLMRARGLQIRIDDSVGSRAVGSGLRQGAGFYSGWIEVRQIAQTPAGLAEICIDGSKSSTRKIRQNGGGDYKHIDAIVGNTVVATNGGFAIFERIPGKAEGWSPITKLVFEQVAGNPLHGVAWCTTSHNGLVGDLQIIGRGIGSNANFPTQTKIDG